MAVTLVIVFSTVAARNIFADTITDLRQKLDISFYMADGVSDQKRENLINKLESRQDLVRNVRYISKEEAQASFAKDSGNNRSQLEALQALDGENPLPASLRVEITDPNQLDELDAIFKDRDFKEAQHPERDPTSTGQRRQTIDTIARAATFTERAGLILCAISAVISILIIFNTIRMAIFNRRDEIHMMKLIGADKGFIKGPFIVEAIMYGLLASVITMAIMYPLMVTQAHYLGNYGVAVEPTIAYLKTNWPLVTIAIMILGAMIGVISSLLAIRRYLKV
jgi:cell division transport system permease protein